MSGAGSILILTSSSAELGKGLLLLFVYSLGLAIPFLAASLALNHFLSAYAKARRHLVWVNRVSGVLLIAVGILLITDYFTVLAGYLQALTPEFLRDRI